LNLKHQATDKVQEANIFNCSYVYLPSSMAFMTKRFSNNWLL